MHLEIVRGLSTEAVLQALLRTFIALRGRTAIIYIDNGTNFTVGRRLLKVIHWKKLHENTADKRIKWTFVPP